MFEKIMLLMAMILLFIGVVSIFLARDFIRKKASVYNENAVVRNVKFVGFVVVVISLLTIYFSIK